MLMFIFIFEYNSVKTYMDFLGSGQAFVVAMCTWESYLTSESFVVLGYYYHVIDTSKYQ